MEFGLRFDDKVAEQRDLIEPLLTLQRRGPALDLGCGPGFQSFALAQIGFDPIYAIDTTQELLAELEVQRAKSPNFSIHTKAANMLTLLDLASPVPLRWPSAWATHLRICPLLKKSAVFSPWSPQHSSPEDSSSSPGET